MLSLSHDVRDEVIDVEGRFGNGLANTIGVGKSFPYAVVSHLDDDIVVVDENLGDVAWQAFFIDDASNHGLLAEDCHCLCAHLAADEAESWDGGHRRVFVLGHGEGWIAEGELEDLIANFCG